MIFILVFVLCLSTLFSCSLGGLGGNTDGGDDGSNSGNDNGNTDGGDDGGDTAPTGTVVFAPGISSTIVSRFNISDKEEQARLIAIMDKIRTATDTEPSVKSDSESEVQNEIVLGETDREITEKANAKLAARIRREIRNSPDEDIAEEDLVGYAVYAEGGSVAIVWSDWHFKDIAINFFLDNYFVDSSLVLNEGYTKTEVVSLSTYLEERGEKIKEEKWAAFQDYLGDQYGKAIVTELRALYTLYTEENYRWVANLYDPGIGGWYWSNSARDNDNYLPSIEETYEALNYIADTGMAEMFDDDYSKAVPEWLKQQIVDFIYPLQDPDGFFYHPQWPKEYIVANGLISRITRDVGSAKSVLRAFGVTPKYSGYTSNENPLTSNLGSGTVSAVSKVVPTASSELLWYYENLDNFKKHLAEYDEKIKASADPVSRAGVFYSLGNSFQSTTGYLNAKPELKAYFIEWLNAYQNPETGVWSDTMCYNMTNAIHKIGSVYNSIGAELKYVDNMVNTVFELLSYDFDEFKSHAGVDIYNAWSCFPYIYTNLRNFGSGTAEEREAKCQEIFERVLAAAPDMIAASFTHAIKLRRDDGSFSYSVSGGQSTAQGCPISVPGTIEGDMNGNGIAMRALVIHIMGALEAEEYFIPFYTEAERVKFIKILEELQPVIKNSASVDLDEEIIYDMEDVPLGQVPEDFTVSLSAGRDPIAGSSIGVERIDGRKVIAVHARARSDANQRNYYLYLPFQTLSQNANVSIMKFDLNVSSNSMKSYVAELTFNKVAGNPVLLPMIRYSGNEICVLDTGGAYICAIGKPNENIHLAIEYYWAQGEFKIYANGTYVGSGYKTYNDVSGGMVGSMTIGTASTISADYTIDNVRIVNTVKTYIDPDREMEDEVPKEPTRHDFEGAYTENHKEWVCSSSNPTGAISSATDLSFDTGIDIGFSTGTYSNQHGAYAAVKTDEGGNKYVYIVAPKRVNDRDRAHSINLMPEKCSRYSYDCLFEMDFKADSYTADGVKSNTAFLQFIVYGASGKYIQYSMSVIDDQIAIGGVKFANWDQWTSIRIKYHHEQGEFQLYSTDAGGNYVFRGLLANGTGSAATPGDLGDGLASIGISGSNNKSSGFSMSIDDIVCATTKLEYVSNQTPTAPEYQAPGGVPEVKTYTVTFVADGVTHTTLTLNANAAFTLPKAPEKAGHVFDGWFFEDGTQLAEDSFVKDNLTSDVTVYAQFSELAKYNVTFMVEGEEYAVISNYFNAAITLPEAPEKAGHVFDGWFFEDGTQLAEDSFVKDNLTSDVTVYAQFSEYIPPQLPGDVDTDGPTYTDSPEIGEEIPKSDDLDDWTN